MILGMTGFFFRGSGLDANYTSILRFGIDENGRPASRFGIISGTQLDGDRLFMRNDGYIDSFSSTPQMVYAKKDFYFTVTYMKKSQATEKDIENFNWNDSNDRMIFYIDGEKFGYTPVNQNLYTYGLSKWNLDTCPFYVGTSIWNVTGRIYYTIGNLYSTRLYNHPISSEDVKANCDSTIQFRNSGL